MTSPACRHLLHICTEHDEHNDQTDDHETIFKTVHIRCEVDTLWFTTYHKVVREQLLRLRNGRGIQDLEIDSTMSESDGGGDPPLVCRLFVQAKVCENIRSV